MEYFYDHEELTTCDDFVDFLVNVQDFDHTFCQGCGAEIEDDGHTDYCEKCKI